jgi:hypothetical protein
MQITRRTFARSILAVALMPSLVFRPTPLLHRRLKASFSVEFAEDLRRCHGIHVEHLVVDSMASEIKRCITRV